MRCPALARLNGVKLKVAFRNVKASALFPTVGLHSRGEAVEVNFGAKPFRFDLPVGPALLPACMHSLSTTSRRGYCKCTSPA